MAAFAERRAVLDNHVAATLGLAEEIDAGTAAPPELVLWPENSTDIDPFRDPTVHADIQRAVDAVGVPVLVGAMVEGPGPQDVRNQGIVWLPGEGPTDRYSKQHPVPFGEYIPMRAQLARFFERLDQIPRDMVAGDEPGVLDVAGTTIGDLICFEVAYDDLVREVVDGGAELLVVQTNNATYMGTGQVEQQFAIARLRAIETGRYAVVVATNGVSGIVAPDGSVRQRAAVREPAVLEDQLPLRVGSTLAVRLGAWPERLLVVVALLGLLLSSSRPRRRSRAESAVDGPAERPGEEPLVPVEPGARGGA
jgi:apolipoprotein N-acyltransferase